jgi:hypothetical protein
VETLVAPLETGLLVERASSKVSVYRLQGIRSSHTVQHCRERLEALVMVEHRQCVCVWELQCRGLQPQRVHVACIGGVHLMSNAHCDARGNLQPRIKQLQLQK